MSTSAPVVKEYNIPMTEPYREIKMIPAVAPDRIIKEPIRQPVPEKVTVRMV